MIKKFDFIDWIRLKIGFLKVDGCDARKYAMFCKLNLLNPCYNQLFSNQFGY